MAKMNWGRLRRKVDRGNSTMIKRSQGIKPKASEAQLKLLKELGIQCTSNMSTKTASKKIKQALKEQKDKYNRKVVKERNVKDLEIVSGELD